MKKVLAVLLSAIVFITAVVTVTVSVSAAPNNCLAGIQEIELSEKHFQSTDEILSALSISDGYIQNIPSEIKEKIATAVRVYKMSDKDDAENELSLRKNMWIFESDAGEYIILGTFEYNRVPIWHGTDVFTVSGDSLVFNCSDFSLIAFYGGSKSEKTALKCDINKTGGQNCIACSYNLPNNITALSNSGLDFLVIASAVTERPDFPNSFLVNLSYSHQKFGSKNVNINFDESCPVSPRALFKTHSIKTADFIEYEP